MAEIEEGSQPTDKLRWPPAMPGFIDQMIDGNALLLLQKTERSLMDS